jgi:hypothetical protein
MRWSWVRKLTGSPLETLPARLTAKLALAEQADQPEDTLLRLSPILNLVSSVDELLWNAKLMANAAVAIAATGWVTLTYVPAGKRWKIRNLDCYLATGTYTFNSFRLYDTVTGGVFATFTAGTNYTAAPPADLKAEQNWQVQVYINSFTGAGNLSWDMIVEESDAY